MLDNKNAVELTEDELDKVSGGAGWQIYRYYILDCICSCGGHVYSERRAMDGGSDCRATCNGCGSVYNMTVYSPTGNVTDSIYTVTLESGTGSIVQNNCRYENR